jgi:hypothetical protein
MLRERYLNYRGGRTNKKAQPAEARRELESLNPPDSTERGFRNARISYSLPLAASFFGRRWRFPGDQAAALLEQFNAEDGIAKRIDPSLGYGELQRLPGGVLVDAEL